MGFISKKFRKKRSKMLDRQFASEIVEIFEEKMDDINIESQTPNQQEKIKVYLKDKTKKELICEIEEFIYSNKNKLVNVP